MSHILAIDPGKTTGLVLYDRDSQRVVWASELGFYDAASTIVRSCADNGSALTVVCESFLITAQTPKNTQAPWSLELIGVARYASHAYCKREIALQAPASAKRFSSDERLRQMGFWTPGKGHANDAARHLLLLLATRGWLSEDTLRDLASQ